MFVNLISDTVTRPTKGMMDAIYNAELGDDVFGTDPTVNRLQAFAAEMFGMEAALYCPSGTMTNQIAIAVHTDKLDEVICHEYSHIYLYETGGYAHHSGIGIKLLPGKYGKMSPEAVKSAINPVFDWYTNSSLLVVENTSNKGGGSIYTLDEIQPFRDICDQQGMNLHLDGARLFNALVETGESPSEVGHIFDSISICLSKGLGAPVGSLLLGDKEFIRQARRFRKVMGGGMRQGGIIAAAGLFALENNIERLKEDHERARRLGQTLERMPYIESVNPIQTNIVIFNVKSPWDSNLFVEKMNELEISSSPFGEKAVRFVTHLDISDEMIDVVIKRLEGLADSFPG